MCFSQRRALEAAAPSGRRALGKIRRGVIAERAMSGLIVFIALIATAACGHPPHRQLLIVVDGLRPDYVTPDVMPRLTALGRRGVVYTHHHSVFPTVTRVNASSMSTGTYPGGHGLMGNSVYFPQVDATRFLDTSVRGDLLRISQATGGHLLTAPTLGESLHAAGKAMLVVSSGSSGSSFLVNHTVAGGAILHYEYALPESYEKKLAETLGAAPTQPDAPPGALDAWAVDALLKVGLPDVAPFVTVIWLGALDSTAHANGVGAPVTIDVLRKVDAQIGRIEDGLKSAGTVDDFDLWVTSDHGFSTHTGGPAVADLIRPYQGKMPDGSPKIVAGAGAIYVRDGDEAAIAGIVSALQKTAGIGAVFTDRERSGSFNGRLPGTLSFDAIHWDHERSSQILYSADWRDEPNAYGFRGLTASDGAAGHGSSSPYEIHNTLIAAGPDLKSGATIDVPSGNVDFAPTFLHLLGVIIPQTMQGRILNEAFASGPAPESMRVETADHAVQNADGSYVLTATFSTVTTGARSYRYFDKTVVTRR
jgi:predicted AlkP superfamily pyrophosphatase or phosphodiesterase